MNSTQIRIMQMMVDADLERGGFGQINGLVLAYTAGLNVSERTELARRVVQNGSLTPEDAYKALQKYTVLPADLYVGYTYPRWDGKVLSVLCEV